MRRIFLGAALAVLSPVQAAEDPAPFHFHRYTLTLDMLPEGPVHALALGEQFGGDDGFLVHGKRRGKHHVEVFRMEPATEGGGPASAAPIGHMDLPLDALAFDVDPGDEMRPGRLLVLDAAGILAWRPGSELTRVVEATSLYRGSLNPELDRLELMQDVDGDCIGDLLVPDFDGWWLARGRADGSFEAPVTFALPVLMNASADRVAYRRPQVVVAGAQLVALVEGEVYRQPLAGGDALRNPSLLPNDSTYLGRGVIIGNDDADQSDLEESGIYLLQDLTGDGIVDAMVQTTRSSGVFDKSTRFLIHPGRYDGDALVFAAEPTSQVESEGIQFDVGVRDIDGDGREDLLAPSVKFTFTRVIAALLSGGFNFNLNFHRQVEDGIYDEDPGFTMSMRVAFDMGSGFVSQPVIKVADLDGDGRLDLVVTGDDDELELRHGTGDEDLFEDRPEVIELTLPEDGDLAQVVDLDRDGRDDLVVRFGPSDPEDLHQVLEILLSRDP